MEIQPEFSLTAAIDYVRIPPRVGEALKDRNWVGVMNENSIRVLCI